LKQVADCPYFNVSSLVKEVNTKRKVLYILNESDYKKTRYIDVDKIFDSLEINELIKYIKLDKDVMNVYDEEIKNRILTYNKALHKSLKDGFKKRILKRATVFYPFIRISNDFICTFFTLIELFEGEKIFVITEAIPGYDCFTKDFKSHLDYIDIALFNVRTGIHIESKIFTYYKDRKKFDKYKHEVTHNYILNNFIKENFSIDFSGSCQVSCRVSFKISSLLTGLSAT
jgi:hypothetical protein